MRSSRFVAVVGPESEMEREDGAAQILRGLGAEVRLLDLWGDPATLFDKREAGFTGPEEVRALVVEVGARPDLGAAVLRALRGDPRLAQVGAIAAVHSSHVARLEPSAGFDDFVLVPYVPAELYARIRAVEWRRSEFSTEERVKIGPILVDRSAHEVRVDGAVLPTTAREFALLSYLCDRRGKVVTRTELLARVWGADYDGGERTVDIHVTRLRSKIGPALPLITIRGTGYRLSDAGRSSTEELEAEEPETGPPIARPRERTAVDEPAQRRARGR